MTNHIFSATCQGCRHPGWPGALVGGVRHKLYRCSSYVSKACCFIKHKSKFNSYSMERSPSWEARRFSASQEIPRILWNLKVHCRVHIISPTVPILSHINPFHKPLPFHFLKNHFNIISRFAPWSSKWSLSLRFPHQNPVYVTPLWNMCYMPRPSHSSRFYRPNNTLWVQVIKLLIM